MRLTEMGSCAGCAAKLGPASLNAAVKGLFENIPRDPKVIVGFGTLDDAGVYKLSDTQALVQTVDFFPPMVDDPYLFGEVAAANALSDIYAMGGLPLTALNITCFPASLDLGILNSILRGGLAKCQEAGVALMGGHTVDAPEIKFGLSVTGTIHSDHIWTNAGAQVGDTLVLTKPIGVGVITTGIKQGVSSQEAIDAALTSMRTLNRAARDAAASVGPNACTDVTGFSLMGHLYQMLRASHATARVYADQIPFLPGALELARQGIGPGGTQRNKAYFGEYVSLSSAMDPAVTELLFDPQTSGGLLVSVSGDKKDALLDAMAVHNVPATVIGEVIHTSDGHVNVV
ncbi:MAG: selenide, water dikinase SelD [Janthinobacterium lividum]